MYKTFTQLKSATVTILAASSLLFASTAIAGPDKPGTKKIVPGGDIVEVAVAANEALGVFNTVLAAATCEFFDGAITDVLAGKGQRTLLAPVDSAFEELGLNAGNVCAAFDGSPEAPFTPENLAQILSYHVTFGRNFSHKVFAKNGEMREIEMADGTIITTSEGKIYDFLMREVNVVKPFFDIPARNGVIHVVDRVLLPFDPNG